MFTITTYVHGGSHGMNSKAFRLESNEKFPVLNDNIEDHHVFVRLTKFYGEPGEGPYHFSFWVCLDGDYFELIDVTEFKNRCTTAEENGHDYASLPRNYRVAEFFEDGTWQRLPAHINEDNHAYTLEWKECQRMKAEFMAAVTLKIIDIPITF